MEDKNNNNKDSNKDNKKIDLIIKIILIIIIILLLIKNCSLLKKNNEYKNAKLPDGNVNIFEIKCDDNKCNTVPKEIENISFLQDTVSVKINDSIKLIPIIKPSYLSSNKFTWTSSDSSIATVDEFGVVRGIKVGTVTITITSSNGKKASCIVNVTEDNIDVKEIKLTLDEPIIKIGESTQIIARISPLNATNRDLIWTSSDSSIAIVDERGYVKGLKNGTVTIMAKTKDGKVVASITITIVDLADSDVNPSDTNVNPSDTSDNPSDTDEDPSDSNSFDVYDNDHTPLTWNGSNDLKIFSNSAYTMDGKISPESSNVYQFMIRNTTAYKLKYKIDFIETNDYHINMKYKLKKNDTYIIDHYVSANELDIDNLIIDVNKKDTYYLEWKWISSDNDNSIGANPEAKYGIRIEVEAEAVNG